MSEPGAKAKSMVVLGVVVLFVCLLGVIVSFVSTPGMREFQFHRTRYEQIVAKIKAMGIEPGSGGHFWMSSDLDPASLTRKRTNNTDMVGMVEVYRDEPTGAYLVIVTTLDRGHFGTFGYAYSETPDRFASPIGPWQSEQKIDSHWCIAANRSW